MSKVTIRDKDLMMIKEYAKAAFRNRPSFLGLDASEMQIYCIIKGLDYFLGSKGIQAFDVEGWVQEDCEPVDDSGLDDAGSA